jgi:hypothetical protein
MTPDDVLDLVLGKVEGVRQHGGYWMARCPAHHDRQASLSVGRGTEQPVVLKCHAGCELADILDAVGLTTADISKPRDQPGGEWTPFGDAVAVYDYTGEDGSLLFQVCRTADKQFPQRRPDPLSRSGWKWRLGGTRRVPYRLPMLLAAIAAGQTVYVAEGEKDVHAIEAAGGVATCNSGGAGNWRDEYDQHFTGAQVVIVADRDEPGYAHAAEVARHLRSVARSVAMAEAAEGKDAADHLAAGHGLGSFQRLNASRKAGAAAGGLWEPPAPLGGHGQLPEFPVSVLPSWAAAEVAAVASFTQTPADLAGTVLLAVLSAACGGRAVVEVCGSWREPVNLYAVAALPSGSRKSAVFAEMTAPLLDTEHSLVEKIQPQILESETERRIAQRTAERAAIAASGIDDNGARKQATADAVAAAQLAEATIIPVMPRLVADDMTPEAAASLLAEQGGRLAVLSAEGGIFAILAGRYSGGIPSLEVFLKGHSGDLLRVDRKGRPPEHIPSPALTLGLCVQPEVLRSIADMPGFRGRGLLARILYSLPANLVGHRQIGTPPVPEDVQAAYATAVRSLVLTMAEWTDPAVLQFTHEAAELILDAERTLEPRLDPDTGDLAGIVDWASKQIGATVRVAALLHLAGHLVDGWGQPIDASTAQAALSVMDYYTAHALAAFDHMGVDQVVEDARVIRRWLERIRPVRFTKREAHMGLSRSRFPKVGDLDAPLALLEQYGYIRSGPEPERTGPGRRPSPAYEVHPDLATETTESTQ